MKTIHTTLLIPRLLIPCLLTLTLPLLRADIVTRPLPTNPDAIRVVTANLRQLWGTTEVDNSTTDLNSWLYRKDIVRDVFLALNADLIGLQEGRQEHLDYLLPFMPNFAYFRLSVLNASGNERPINPGNAILYNTNRFELVRGDGLYLCEDPREVQGSYPESLSVRFCNWVILRDKRTGVHIQFLNLHLDHLTGDPGAQLRGKQVAVALDAMHALRTGGPQIITGDFNGTALTDQTYYFYSRLTLQNGWADTWAESGNTVDTTSGNPNPTSDPNFNGATTGSKLDYIFRRGPIRATHSEIIRDYALVDNVRRYPSDHFFVMTDLEYDTSAGPLDGTASIATWPEALALNSPAGLAITAENILFVADEGAHQIKRFSGIGTNNLRSTTLAGNGVAGYLDSTAGVFAMLHHPRSIALLGDFCYAADHGNRVLRAIDIDVTTTSLFAGAPPASYTDPFLSLDGDLQTARFSGPASIVIAPGPTFYVADATAHVIRKITAAGPSPPLPASPAPPAAPMAPPPPPVLTNPSASPSTPTPKTSTSPTPPTTSSAKSISPPARFPRLPALPAFPAPPTAIPLPRVLTPPPPSPSLTAWSMLPTPPITPSVPSMPARVRRLFLRASPGRRSPLLAWPRI